MTSAIQKRLIQILFLVLAQAVVLFVSAGKWDWWNAWAYMGEYLAFLVFNLFVLLPGHKSLVEERSRAGEGAKSWDKVISLVTFFLGFLILVIAGLDERLGWPGSLPLWAQVLFMVLLAASYPLFTWAMVSNRFFSTLVRIQKERGHTVQTGGPYRFVRHPGYASLLCSYMLIPLALGSLWACLPALLLVANLVLRTSLEDRTLQVELEGYREYAARVRFRLIPGIW
jgi:protein-S-isoprenylcysteine O-methyltransferase Ste14